MARVLVYLSSHGRALEPAHATVNAYDRGFLYGDSVYETLRTRGGAPVEWARHVARLHASAEGIGLAIPFSDAHLREVVMATHAQAENPESKIRVVVTRGVGKLVLDTRVADDPLLVVYVEPLVELSQEAYARGISAALVGVSGGLRGAEPGLKTGNYLRNILALRRAIEARGDDAIMCNAEGLVVEGASSNVFVVKDGAIATPALDAGLLAGITRAVVIELAAALGLPIQERAVRPAELAGADELFLTSSVRGIMAVTRLDGAVVGGRPEPGEGPITRRLRAAYERYLDGFAAGSAG